MSDFFVLYILFDDRYLIDQWAAAGSDICIYDQIKISRIRLDHRIVHDD